MNPFIDNSSFMDRIDSAMRSHERVFNMIHNRMKEEISSNLVSDQFPHRQIYQSRLHTGSSGRFNEDHQGRFGEERTLPLLSMGSDTKSSTGVRRHNTLAREGIKALSTTGRVGSISPQRSGYSRTTSASRSKRNDPATAAAIAAAVNSGPGILNSESRQSKYVKSLGFGWYQVSPEDSGSVAFRSARLSIAGAFNAGYLIVYDPINKSPKSPILSVEIRTEVMLGLESQGLINVILCYQGLQSLVNSVQITQYPFLLPFPLRQGEFYKVVVHMRRSAVTVLLNEALVFAWNSEEGIALDLNDSYIAGILCLKGNRIVYRDWKLNFDVPMPVVPEVLDQSPSLPTKDARSITPSKNTANVTKPTPQRSLRAFLEKQEGAIEYSAPSRELPAPLSSASIVKKALPNSSTTKQSSANNSTSLVKAMITPHAEIMEKLRLLPYEKEIIQIIVHDIVCYDIGVSFDDIAALEGPKRILNEAVVLPLIMPEFFTGLREPWKGVLLFGPPGTGKTMLAKAVASMHHCTFFNCSASSLVSKWRGDSEKLVKCLFEAARVCAPSVIFLDEVDALVSSRGSGGEHEASRRMKTEFFAQMDGITSAQEVTKRVMVLATTNCPWDLDSAVLRRFEKRIYIPLPDCDSRKTHFRMCLQDLGQVEESKTRKKSGKDLDLFQLASSSNETFDQAEDDEDTAEYLADLTAGYSSADIVLVCREAAMAPMRRLLAENSIADIQRMRTHGTLGFSKILRSDFEESFRKTKPSVPTATIGRYESWNQLYGTAATI